MELKISVEFPNGQVANETDVTEFKRNVSGQIGEIAKRNNLEFIEHDEPPPEGALGVEQLIQFIVENFESIVQISKNTAIIVQAVNSLTQMFIKKKREKENKNPTVKITIGEKEIELPANSKEIDAFVSEVREKYEERK